MFAGGARSPDGTRQDGCEHQRHRAREQEQEHTDHGILEGPGIVTIEDGEVFTSNGCSTWTLTS